MNAAAIDAAVLKAARTRSPLRGAEVLSRHRRDGKAQRHDRQERRLHDAQADRRSRPARPRRTAW